MEGEILVGLLLDGRRRLFLSNIKGRQERGWRGYGRFRVSLGS